MRVERRLVGDVHVLTPGKDLMGGEETRELDEAIKEIAAQGNPKIVIDLGKVSFLNSTGLGALTAAHISCQNHGGWLRVARIGKRIHNLFLITRLTFVLETYDSVEDALVGPHPGGAKS